MLQTNRVFLKYFILFCILFAGCSADLQTKSWAVSTLKDQMEIILMPNFLELRYIENNAIAFSLLSELPENIRLPLIFAMTTSAILFLVLLIGMWRNKKFVELFPLILILSGAIGNVYDRYTNGYVIDFFHFHYKYQYSFPIFNVADVLVFCGTCLMFYQYWKNSRQEPQEQVAINNEVI